MGVMPFPVKGAALDVIGAKLRVGYYFPSFIEGEIYFCANGESLFGACGADEYDNPHVVNEGHGPPIV